MKTQSKQQERITQIFNQLNADNTSILDNFYAENIRFIDPIGEHNGLDPVKNYYKNMYKNVRQIRFEFSKIVSQENDHTAMWKMHLIADGLKNGEEVVLDGNSHIIFNEEGLVTYHRDYFDMGQFIYEHVPILNWLIKLVKNKLQTK